MLPKGGEQQVWDLPFIGHGNSSISSAAPWAGSPENLINWEPSIHHVGNHFLRSAFGHVYTFRLYAKLVASYQLEIFKGFCTVIKDTA